MTPTQARYRTFFEDHGNKFPLFFQPWWLDLVCGADRWDAALASDKQGNLTGVMPYYWKRFWGFRIITMPKLTPWLGPWLLYPDDLAENKRWSFEKNVLTELIENLPSFLFLRMKCHPGFTNWLPFYWKGFRQTTRYTFRVESEPAESWRARLKYKVRYAIRKGASGSTLLAHPAPETGYRLLQKTFAANGVKTPFSLDFYLQMDQVLASRNSRTVLYAGNSTGLSHTMLYLAHDTRMHYALFIAADPALRPYGSVQWLFDQAFQKMEAQSNVLDFEGSMLPGVADLFSDLGGSPCAYFELWKGRFPLLECLYVLLRKGRFKANIPPPTSG